MISRLFICIAVVLSAAVLLAAIGPAGRAPFGAPAEAEMEMEAEERASVIALKLHADWCGSCKAMGTVFTDLGNKFDTEPVLFLTLDFTSQSARRQAQYHARALGLDAIWAQDGGKTGLVLLIDAKSKAVLARLTREHDLKAMGAELAKAIETASGH